MSPTISRSPDASLTCDALVIGAGPAGAAAARVLAAHGVDTILVDRHDFPREKVCGDALIPDALAALGRLSLKERVLERAVSLQHIRIYAPNKSYVELEGEFACLPREVLDDTLRRGAVESGARFVPRMRVTKPLTTGALVIGAHFVDIATEAGVDIRSRFTILATGAAAGPLQLFEVCERDRASAMAARVYYEVPEKLAEDYRHLCISYDREICPGYGWIFPGPNRIFNVGVGFFYDAKTRPPTTNIRLLLERFIAKFPPARRLAADARAITPLRGAPLRTALTGARLSRPGLFVAGEAAGLTYSFSGEGIGKAIESGILAAELIAGSRGADVDFEELAAAYGTRIRRDFADRFRGYRIAQRWLGSPAFANFLAGRANKGRYVRRQLEDMLMERGDPTALFSLTGLFRALFQ